MYYLSMAVLTCLTFGSDCCFRFVDADIVSVSDLDVRISLFSLFLSSDAVCFLFRSWPAIEDDADLSILPIVNNENEIDNVDYKLIVYS